MSSDIARLSRHPLHPQVTFFFSTSEVIISSLSAIVGYLRWYEVPTIMLTCLHVVLSWEVFIMTESIHTSSWSSTCCWLDGVLRLAQSQHGRWQLRLRVAAIESLVGDVRTTPQRWRHLVYRWVTLTDITPRLQVKHMYFLMTLRHAKLYKFSLGYIDFKIQEACPVGDNFRFVYSMIEQSEKIMK